MNRIDRLFGIMTLLQSKKYITAEQIADKFQISVRTVYRDVKALGEQGIPVSFEPSKGYYIVQGYFLPPVAFNSEEANALLLMESLVQGFSDRSIRLHYTNALNKVKAVLKNSQREKLEMMHENIRFQLPTCFNSEYEYLTIIQEAVTSRRSLKIDYKNNREESSQRLTEPIGLIFYAFSWHMIAWCQLRSEYRDFKVSRIAKLQVTSIPFSNEIHIELNEYMKLLPVNY